MWGTGDVDMWGTGVGQEQAEEDENGSEKKKSFLSTRSLSGLFRKQKSISQKQLPIEKEKSLLEQYYVSQTREKVESFGELIDKQVDILKTKLKKYEFINLGSKDDTIDLHVERAKKSDAVRRFVKESKDLQRRDPTFFLEPSRFVKCVSPCGPTEESRYKCTILAQVLFRVRASGDFVGLLQIFQRAFVEKLSKRQ